MADQKPPADFRSALHDLKDSVKDLVHTAEAPLQSFDRKDSALQPTAHDPLFLPSPDRGSVDAQLLTQHTPGWNIPNPSRIAAPSWAPFMCAFGLVFVALGAVTQWPLSIIGAVIFFLGIAKWIGELLHD
jgi:hypothetical protein